MLKAPSITAAKISLMGKVLFPSTFTSNQRRYLSTPESGVGQEF